MNENTLLLTIVTCGRKRPSCGGKNRLMAAISSKPSVQAHPAPGGAGAWACPPTLLAMIRRGQTVSPFSRKTIEAEVEALASGCPNTEVGK